MEDIYNRMQSLLSPSMPVSTFKVVQEGPIQALALNKDFTQVAIGGRNVFKIYCIDDEKFREAYNLKTSKHLNLNFCNDVAWSLTDDHYLATAATNGHVCVWNISKIGKSMQEQNYQEHKRTVNKVNFHHSEPYKLMSASQDGTMRYFDVRMKASVATFYCNGESVRDVQFSPHSPNAFASVTESGNCHLWDIRRTDKYQLKFTAHMEPIFTCDWHPETTWLATGSRDKTIKVWETSGVRPALEYTVQYFTPVGHIKWRPQRRYHLASCALVIDSDINIWDIRRPYVPFAVFQDHSDFASRVAWRGDSNALLSCGRDCLLIHHAFTDAVRPASRANIQGVSINPDNDVMYAYKIPAASGPLSVIRTAVGGIMRKSSTTNMPDQFLQVTSALHLFTQNDSECHDSGEIFKKLAHGYILHGRSLSEMCDHNSNVAQQLGKHHISTVWKIIKTLYGEEFTQNSLAINNNNSNNNNNNSNNNRDEVLSHTSNPIPFQNIELEQRSKGGGGDTSTAHSGGDDETEGEDQVDHALPSYFPTFLNTRSKGDFSFGDNELDMELDGIGNEIYYGSSYRPYPPRPVLPSLNQDWTLPSEAFAIRHDILDPPLTAPHPSSLSHSSLLDPHHSIDPHHSLLDPLDDQSHPSGRGGDLSRLPGAGELAEEIVRVGRVSPMPAWDPGDVVAKALEHHVALGDVQTAVSVLLAMGDMRWKVLEKGIGEKKQEEWLEGYLELLTRYKLWNVSTQVINLSWLESINTLNQRSTTYWLSCGECTRPARRHGWECHRCQIPLATCSVCHQVVRGMYVWCQQCSHGGHLMHMKQWLKENKQCPTGCGHECEYR